MKQSHYALNFSQEQLKLVRAGLDALKFVKFQEVAQVMSRHAACSYVIGHFGARQEMDAIWAEYDQADKLQRDISVETFRSDFELTKGGSQ